ncbi:hypothetical protein Ancab_035753 [Ancistrocladus abbreviatus]
MQQSEDTNGMPPTLPPPSRLPPAPVTPPGLADSQTQTQVSTQMEESPHPPLGSDSPLRSHEPEKPTAVEKYYSPLTSPLPATPPKNASTTDFSFKSNKLLNSHIISFNSAVVEETAQSALVVASGGVGGGSEGGGGGLEGGVVGKRLRKKKGVTFGVVEEIVGRSKREEMIKRVTLGLRFSEFVLCLISLSIMAADKTQGWSGDSFDRYKEYRFCLSVNAVALVYAGFQAYVLGYHLVTGKHVLTHHLHHQFDFIMDQLLAYLLISASSAAATRVADWQSNWGKDEFTEKASASVSVSFLAFLAFAVSSLISGYNMCNHDFA